MLYSQTPVLILKLGVDFVLPLSQEEEQDKEQEQLPPKSKRKMLTAGWIFGTYV